MSWSDRAYRTLLRLYPAPFRGEYGAQMTDLFAARLQRENAFTLWLEVITDLGCTAPKEHTAMLWNDIRHSFRAFAKSPGFAIFAVLSLALGIGVNTSIFQFVSTVMLEELPVRHPEQLVGLARTGPKYYKTNFSYPLYQDLRTRTDVFDGLIARAGMRLSMSGQSGAEIVRAELVSGNYFQVLGVEAAIGRTFTPDDERTPGAHPVAVLTYGFWERRFGRDSGVIGKKILIAGHPFTVVGVTRKGFVSTEPGFVPDLQVPIIMQNQVVPGRDTLASRGTSWFEVYARISPSVGVKRAQEAGNAVYMRSLELMAEAAHGDAASMKAGQRLEFFPASRGDSGVRDALGKPLLVMLALSALVLLLTCANVANLLYARAAARQREVALRVALGAGRIRLMRHFLTESMLIATMGGVFGILLSIWCMSVLPKLIPRGTGITLELHPVPLTFAFAVAITTLSALFFGLLPALRSSKADVAPALQEGFGGHSSGKWRHTMRSALVAAQVAFSTVLLLGAALFGRTLDKLRATELGFDRSNVYLFSLNPGLNGYKSPQSAAFFQQILDRARTMPGVESAAISQIAILGGGGSRSTVNVEGYRFKPGEDRNLNDNQITPGYFHTLRIPLLLGRDFTDADRRGGPKVCIINEAAARYFFGASNPIGRRIAYGRDTAPDMEIVGVVKDGKYRNVREDTWRTMYVPFWYSNDTSGTLHVRASGDSKIVAGGFRSILRELDSNLPVLSSETLAERVDRNLAIERLVTFLSSSFGVLSLLLAAIGLYGVISCSVSERIREIGIRIAIGARPADVVRMILKQTGWLFGTGLVVGLGAALALGRLVQSMLFGVVPHDAQSIAMTVVVLAITSLAASYMPARRSTRVDPTKALKYD